MPVIVLQVSGWVAFVVGTLAAGSWLRRHPSKVGAETSSKVVHGLFFVGLVFPSSLGTLCPGLGSYDRLLGVPSLPFRKTTRLTGAALILAELYLLVASNVALRRLGQGANAFRLTRQLVVTDIYQRTRNPMSLGAYLSWVGAGLWAGSTSLTLAALVAMVPAHVFAVRYFEEMELELRLGQPYRDYRSKVPFLLPRLGHGW